MLAYIARRIVYVIPIVISVALVCFLLVHITPGDPLVAVLPADASQELAAAIAHRLRLRPSAAGAVRALAVDARSTAISAIPSPPGARC